MCYENFILFLDESNSDPKPACYIADKESNHKKCEVLNKPKEFSKTSSLKSYNNEDSKIETQPVNYASQNRSSVSAQSTEEENIASTNSIDNHTSEEVLIQENKVKLRIASIRQQAEPFEDLIKEFTEPSDDTNEYHYIEESLKRFVDQLDEMYDDINGNKVLRMQRKEVYRLCFKLFDDLDAKLEENKILCTK